MAAKRYAAHINYAVALEAAGDTDAAVTHYQAALSIDGRSADALSALSNLDALPEPTPINCQTQALSLASYTSPEIGPTTFISITGQQFTLTGQPWMVRGVNYYPRHAPWERFLTQGRTEDMAAELDLIAAAGFNTLRIFLWYDPLFLCDPEQAIPNPEAFETLDALIALAAERDLRLIVTLNDLPDLYIRPLYTDWARYDAQTAFIVSRYRNEPTIMAWDLRNEGDLDYGADSEGQIFEQETVLNWLAHSTELVRGRDPNHLITAGWWGDPTPTARWVDFVSFHHWTTAEDLPARITALQQHTTQPILIEEAGFPSWGENGEALQAQILHNMTTVAEENGTAGWLIWSAFDFTPAPNQPVTSEHCFGLWRTNLTPKPVLQNLPYITVEMPEVSVP